MTQSERRKYLISVLLREEPRYSEVEIPADEREQRLLLRSLFNIRTPRPATEDFLKVQDEYLQEETARKGVTELADLQPIQENLYLRRGDITTLRCDGVVNAANSQLLGCFCPNHGCIDNAVHTFAGVQLRLACAEIMKRQGHEEAPGRAKITPAFNLPCRYVLHTVGPIVHGRLTKNDEKTLVSCYRSCLKLAEQNGLKSVAFCCISTGEFHFPNDKAARLAVRTVNEYRERTNSRTEVIFNVFKELDYNIYRELLTAD